MPASYGEEELLLRDGGTTVPPLILRPLIRSDVPAIEALCAASFPIQYPGCWFEEVVGGELISVGLFDDKQLVAMMVAEMKTILHCNPEVRIAASCSYS
ncbi:hypothetical protein TELCIR_11798 [Teladorsagia circumcincta]|uniref:N-acetyltransferase domain-containing protein n=1 Tax=Teladorsagia circumcincta TaxID=45464 RepID=A0A2G9U877_TELCI|nr:hypothetical protein TELCIR_11798 [Teladorsagia circumcincta]